MGRVAVGEGSDEVVRGGSSGRGLDLFEGGFGLAPADVLKYGAAAPTRNFFLKDEQADQSAPVEAINRLVEPDGIEPTTSCLQSTRSPN